LNDDIGSLKVINPITKIFYFVLWLNDNEIISKAVLCCESESIYISMKV